MLVFLFGSYDSRGGTTAVVASDCGTAYRTYAEAIFLAELGLDHAAQRAILDAEYLGAANLGGDLPLGVEGVDLEWDDGAVLCRITDGYPPAWSTKSDPSGSTVTTCSNFCTSRTRAGMLTRCPSRRWASGILDGTTTHTASC